MFVNNTNSQRSMKFRKVIAELKVTLLSLKSVLWTLAEFHHNRIVQSPHEDYFNVCRQLIVKSREHDDLCFQATKLFKFHN